MFYTKNSNYQILIIIPEHGCKLETSAIFKQGATVFHRFTVKIIAKHVIQHITYFPLVLETT